MGGHGGAQTAAAINRPQKKSQFAKMYMDEKCYGQGSADSASNNRYGGDPSSTGH